MKKYLLISAILVIGGVQNASAQATHFENDLESRGQQNVEARPHTREVKATTSNFQLDVISKTKVLNAINEYAVTAVLTLNNEQVCTYVDQKVSLIRNAEKKSAAQLHSECDHQFTTKAYITMYTGVFSSGFNLVVESFNDEGVRVASSTSIISNFPHGSK